MPRIIYINVHAARYGWYYGRRLPRGYRLAAHFWGSGLIDRTRTIWCGFPYEVLYPIPRHYPAVSADPRPLDALCDHMGMSIVNEAIRADRAVNLFWSGGIDSTAAYVAVSRAAKALGAESRVLTILTRESIDEYPLLFDQHIRNGRYRMVSSPVTSHLDHRCINVTGEHGDQVFGSAKAERYVADGRAFEDWPSALPGIFAEALDSNADADTLLAYIEPLLYSAPLPLRSVFDAFWWINFALKWQIVGLRLAVFRRHRVRATFDSLRHLFSHPSFQVWSLNHRDQVIGTTWESYKMPLKEYIFGFTGDEQYRRDKTKLPSLREVLKSDLRRDAPTYCVLMDERFEPAFKAI